MIVVDTNVVSELMRFSPSAAVVEWWRAMSGADVCTTSITVAEIRYGIERLPRGTRTSALRAAADEAFTAFRAQILGFDADAAGQYALLVPERERAGVPISGFDAQIAAICRTHSASLATRNVKDFAGTGLHLIDPWQGQPPG